MDNILFLQIKKAQQDFLQDCTVMWRKEKIFLFRNNIIFLNWRIIVVLSALLGNEVCCDLSWKCPGHVLGTGTCPKIPGTESDCRQFYLSFFLRHVSAACTLSKSHVRYSKKNKETEKANQRNLLNLLSDD